MCCVHQCQLATARRDDLECFDIISGSAEACDTPALASPWGSMADNVPCMRQGPFRACLRKRQTRELRLCGVLKVFPSLMPTFLNCTTVTDAQIAPCIMFQCQRSTGDDLHQTACVVTSQDGA